MSIASDAFEDIFPDKNVEDYALKVKYNDRFKPYNANVKYSKNSFTFNLSKKWKRVSREIQIGLLQGLLLKVFKEKKETFNIDLYNNFMKRIHIAVPKTKTDPILEQSFNKINENYFFGLIERPNLEWHDSIRRLGSYEYGSDTISISKILQDDIDILDYVMYHEILHKKHKFHNKNGRSYHHTKEFRQKEKQFEKSHEMEEKIKKLVRKNTRKRLILF